MQYRLQSLGFLYLDRRKHQVSYGRSIDRSTNVCVLFPLVSRKSRPLRSSPGVGMDSSQHRLFRRRQSTHHLVRRICRCCGRWFSPSLPSQSLVVFQRHSPERRADVQLGVHHRTRSASSVAQIPRREFYSLVTKRLSDERHQHEKEKVPQVCQHGASLNNVETMFECALTYPIFDEDHYAYISNAEYTIQDGGPMFFLLMPVIDGTFLPDNPITMLKTGNFKVPTAIDRIHFRSSLAEMSFASRCQS